MSQVIQLLDTAGSNAKLSAADYTALVAKLQIDADQKQALLDRDHVALAAMLNGPEKPCCHISLPYSDEPEPMQDEEDVDLPEREE